ncbi:hypothetical protein BP5796_03893 [Coleophoma crateriformis]|uniref:Uncharacterized protein n=1 Tax=Coleophoma crateriformis TaxID=565419 RepID=A0A3D8SIF4_9HELO|nr:hypothetical protein BP5796_03893 [Coleophoma crateriformis]
MWSVLDRTKKIPVWEGPLRLRGGSGIAVTEPVELNDDSGSDSDLEGLLDDPDITIFSAKTNTGLLLHPHAVTRGTGDATNDSDSDSDLEGLFDDSNLTGTSDKPDSKENAFRARKGRNNQIGDEKPGLASRSTSRFPATQIGKLNTVIEHQPLRDLRMRLHKLDTEARAQDREDDPDDLKQSPVATGPDFFTMRNRFRSGFLSASAGKGWVFVGRFDAERSAISI